MIDAQSGSIRELQAIVMIDHLMHSPQHGIHDTRKKTIL
jgi:hypothetical protein